jgi:hypothetical protein
MRCELPFALWLVFFSGSTVYSESRTPKSAITLESARAVFVMDTDGRRGPFHTHDPEKVKQIATSVREHAWPPIEKRQIGNVKSRFKIAFFNTPNATEPALLVIPIYHRIARASEQIHVSDEDYATLLKLVGWPE